MTQECLWLPCLTPNSPARRLESSGIPFVVEYSAKKLCASIVHFVPTFLFDFTILVPDDRVQDAVEHLLKELPHYQPCHRGAR